MTKHNTNSCSCEPNSYYCGVCGKIFESIEERNVCEAKCLKDRAKAEAALKKQKLEAEKNIRKEEIENKWKELNTLMSGYIKDYGSIQLGERHVFDDDYFPSVNKLLGWWF